MKNDFFLEPVITRKTPLILLYKIISLALIFNIFFIITSIIYVYMRQYFWRPIISEPTVFLTLFIIEIVIFLILIINWFNEYIYINDNFLLYKKWILFTKEIRYNLDTINNIDIEQNFINNFLRYWDIIISNNNSITTNFNSIPYPEQFVYLIEQKIDISRTTEKEDK